MKRPRILLVASHLASFIEQDRKILEEVGDVSLLLYRGRSHLPRLLWSILTSDIVVCWFVLGYAASSVWIARRLRKPTVLVAGGWDVSALPELGYGAMLTRGRIRKTVYALTGATSVLAVSETTKRDVLRWVRREVKVVPNAVDVEFFRPGGRRQRTVVTVAGVDSKVRFETKGLDVLFAVAAEMESVPFWVIGRNAPQWRELMRSMAPENVHFRESVDRGQLRSAYQAAWVYAQLSARESFGMALAEAMACGCVPVVSDRGALPETVGDSGYIVPYGNVEATREVLYRALGDKDGGSRARVRVTSQFDLTTRKHALRRELIDVLTRSDGGHT